ncbi:Serine phosphatase RsbU, regulator of sigma subunit [hydrothermal vent metagenome]|uniref:Serine phosphatase RsbU, regulator of sigma subunit n=1 Tax=hydrothermal vent metagenome TaxID=652676 RepID=A0A3B1APA9_9ZZZZ
MKILIVDDNKVNIKVLSPFLKKWGYSIIECYDGLQAIEKFKTESPDLILMDIVMPEMNGREAAKKIKALSAEVYTPIIFVTALKAEMDIVDALESGGDDYISKPFDKNLLYSKIKVHERIVNLNAELDSKNKKLTVYNQRIRYEQELVGHFFDWGQEMCDIDPSYINYYTSPASAFNGDLFLVRRRPSGGLYVLVGDFTGHGLTAAIGTIPVTEIFFRMAEKNYSVVDIVREINQKLNQILPVEIFFAATVMEVDQYASTISVWSGGLPECYIVDMENNKLLTVSSDHMPLAVLDDNEFDSSIKTYSIAHGMKLYCFTDGVIESFNDVGEMYGDERIRQVLLKENEDTIESLLNDVKNFTHGKKQSDDTTIVEINFKPLDDLPCVIDDSANTNIMPFSLEFKLSVNAMRKQHSLLQVADMLDGNNKLRQHKSYLYTVITELYVNALEHGVLGLASGDKTDPDAFDEYYQNKKMALEKLTKSEICINVFMPETCDKVFITVTHNGEIKKTNHSSIDADEQLFGRGLGIVKSLCHEFEYLDYGRVVKATYLV